MMLKHEREAGAMPLGHAKRRQAITATAIGIARAPVCCDERARHPSGRLKEKSGAQRRRIKREREAREMSC